MKIKTIINVLISFIPLLYFITLCVSYWFYNNQPTNFELAILIFTGYAGFKNGK